MLGSLLPESGLLEESGQLLHGVQLLIWDPPNASWELRHVPLATLDSM